VERICNKHASLHIVPEQYAIVGEFLLKAITDVLGADVFKGELYDAWYAAYWQLAHIFFNREAELYRAAAWEGWKEFIVKKKVKESDEITSFYFVPKDGKPVPAHHPGQYICVQKYIKELGYNQSRPCATRCCWFFVRHTWLRLPRYSLSDAPHADYFRISVKRDRGIRATDPVTGAVDTTQAGQLGWMSNLLHDKLAEGDTVELAPPFGDFFLADASARRGPVVLISAGVGVTPLASMLHDVLERPESERARRPVSWVQAVRSRAAHPLREEVQRLLGRHPELVRRAIFYSAPGAEDVQGEEYDVKGRLDVATLDAGVLRLEDPSAEYYVCGPEAFMADVLRALRARGVGISRLHAEVFGQGAIPL
jgi:nitric oxide dioxygenase